MKHITEYITDGYTDSDTGKDYPYTIEIITRDKTGRNDTVRVVWDEVTPKHRGSIEDQIIQDYIL